MAALSDSHGGGWGLVIKEGWMGGGGTGNLRRSFCSPDSHCPPHALDLATDYEDWVSNLLSCSKLSSPT